MFKQFLVFIFFFGHFILLSQNSEIDLKLKSQIEQEKLEKELVKFEDLAEKFLAENPLVKKAFEEKLKTDKNGRKKFKLS